MSMPRIEKAENPIDRNQSVSNLIESVALMETGLSHIINAEGEKIQKVIKSDDPTAEVPIEDIINVNNSVERMVNTVSKLEMILQNKLDISKDLDQESPGPVIESSGAIITYTGPITVSTLTNGSPDSGTVLYESDANNYIVDLNGNADTFNWSEVITTYIIPRAGILTDFSATASIVAATGANVDKQIVVRVYRADPNSTTYNAIPEATINLPPIPAGTQDDFRMNGSVNGLNIELEKDTKILTVVYGLTEIGIANVRGALSASLNIA